MAYKHETTRRVDSAQFPGTSYVLRKMTEGRRIDLRRQLSEYNHRVRDILKEQAEIERMPEDDRDMPKWLNLQEEFDGIMIEKINPVWISWGVKLIEGLEADGRALGTEDWQEWPSALLEEVVNAVKSESELNGAERKNSESPTTSGEQEATSLNPSTVTSVSGRDSGEPEIAQSISLVK